LAQARFAKTNRVTGKQAVDQVRGMEQSIRRIRPDIGASVNLLLAVTLVAVCSVNALLLFAYL
jgi:hypothetical protein